MYSCGSGGQLAFEERHKEMEQLCYTGTPALFDNQHGIVA